MNHLPTLTPEAPSRDAQDWRTSPDLMSLDDKLDAAFGPADPATAAWVEASLLIGTADCEVAW